MSSRYRIKSSSLGFVTHSYPALTFSERNCNVWGTHPAGEVQLEHTLTEEIWDNVVPGFKAMQKSGKILPVNPAKIVKVQRRPEIFPAVYNFRWCCTCSPLRADAGASYDNYVVPFADPYPLSMDAYQQLTGQALKTSLAKAKEPIWDLLTAAAEAQETFSYVAGRLHDAADLLFKFKKKVKDIGSSFKNPRATAKAISSAELELRYAITPLYLDIKAIIELMASDPQLRSRGYSYEPILDEFTESQDIILPWTSNQGIVTATRTVTVQGEFRGFTLLLSKLKKLSVGINPLVTAWEKIPLSFVYDWFVDVGDTLLALSPQLETEIAGMGTSLRLTAHENVTVAIKQQPTSATCCGPVYNIALPKTSATTHVQSFYERRPNAWNDISFLPRVKVNLSHLRLLDAIALLTQAGLSYTRPKPRR